MDWTQLLFWPVLLAVIWLCLAGVRKLFPPEPLREGEPTADELRPKYFRHELKGMGLFLATSLFLAMPALWVVLYFLGKWSELWLPAGDYVLRPLGVCWGPPAMFLGFGVGGVVLELYDRRVWGAEFAAFRRYQDLAYRMSSRALTMPMVALILGFSAILIGGFLDTYAVVRQDEVIVNRIFSLREDRLPFAELEAIQTAPAIRSRRGKTVEQRVWLCRFSEGRVWSSYADFCGWGESGWRKIMTFIAAHSGKEIEETPLLDSAELPFP